MDYLGYLQGTGMTPTQITVYCITSIVMAILIIIATWMLFKKAGEAGWKAIIPVVSGYTFYKICWNTTMFWIALVAAIAAFVCVNLMTVSGVFLAIAIILTIVSGVIGIISYFKLSKAFGHGAGFAIGLILVNPVFMLILAFGSSEYVKKDYLSKN